MKVLVLIVLTLMLASPLFAKQTREQKQVELDSACEVARQKKLMPIREGFVEECVANKEKPDREHCERFYADYGNKMGGRAALFLDLPECEAAFEFNRSDRSGN
jgi:hypothetical protein